MLEHSLAIEADGPSHFSRTSGRLLSSGVLKRRHLRRSGWRVLSVPLATWEELIGPEERRRYLEVDRVAGAPTWTSVAVELIRDIDNRASLQ
eukprot:jgi/Tetstr1/438136/TSEL_002862.t1